MAQTMVARPRSPSPTARRPPSPVRASVSAIRVSPQGSPMVRCQSRGLMEGGSFGRDGGPGGRAIVAAQVVARSPGRSPPPPASSLRSPCGPRHGGAARPSAHHALSPAPARSPMVRVHSWQPPMMMRGTINGPPSGAAASSSAASPVAAVRAVPVLPGSDRASLRPSSRSWSGFEAAGGSANVAAAGAATPSAMSCSLSQQGGGCGAGSPEVQISRSGRPPAPLPFPLHGQKQHQQSSSSSSRRISSNCMGDSFEAVGGGTCRAPVAVAAALPRAPSPAPSALSRDAVPAAARLQAPAAAVQARERPVAPASSSYSFEDMKDRSMAYGGSSMSSRPKAKPYHYEADADAETEAEEYAEPSSDLQGLLSYLSALKAELARFTEATYIMNDFRWWGVPLRHHGFVLKAEGSRCGLIGEEYLTLDFSRRGILWDVFDEYPNLPDNTVFEKTYKINVDPLALRDYCEDTKPFSFMSNDCARWARGMLQVLRIKDPMAGRSAMASSYAPADLRTGRSAREGAWAGRGHDIFTCGLPGASRPALGCFS
eukprot:TRINITY_DN873_c0_g1_i1.p1 TRINITY_DN873_c0_g1~~TRINITY_DN873_c0_g1_i1.p1  ORF type:complete len:543 (+),score=97.16 TRINITY_DN873_c0_g1_i1:112-1740(+)